MSRCWRALAASLLLSQAPLAHAAAASWPLPSGDVAAAQPALAVDASGALFLSWVERRGEGVHRLRFARATADGRFGAARTIAEGRDWFVNWADFPGVLPLQDGRLAAFVLRKSAALPYAYDLLLLRSSDGGRQWSAPQVVHDDGTTTEHGFATLWPEAEGALGIAWLDGRATVVSQGASGHHGHGAGAMTLRAARFGDQGKEAEWPLDQATCDCCQTDAARTADGVVLVYRDRSPEEVRDIAIVRRSDAGPAEWSAPALVHADGWHMPACPVNGPAVAARQEQVAVAWYTAAGQRPRVQLAQSDDGGRQFGTPRVLAEGTAVAGRVDVAWAGDSVLVSWMEESGPEQQLWLARIADDGSISRQRVASLAARGRASGFPRLAVSGGQAFLAWTDVADGAPRLRGARIALDAP